MSDLPKGGDISDFIESISQGKQAPAQEKVKSAIEGLMANATPYVAEIQAESGKGEIISGNGKPTAATKLMNLATCANCIFKPLSVTTPKV